MGAASGSGSVHLGQEGADVARVLAEVERAVRRFGTDGHLRMVRVALHMDGHLTRNGNVPETNRGPELAAARTGAFADIGPAEPLDRGLRAVGHVGRTPVVRARPEVRVLGRSSGFDVVELRPG